MLSINVAELLVICVGLLISGSILKLYRDCKNSVVTLFVEFKIFVLMSPHRDISHSLHLYNFSRLPMNSSIFLET